MLNRHRFYQDRAIVQDPLGCLEYWSQHLVARVCVQTLGQARQEARLQEYDGHLQYICLLAWVQPYILLHLRSWWPFPSSRPDYEDECQTVRPTRRLCRTVSGRQEAGRADAYQAHLRPAVHRLCANGDQLHGRAIHAS